MDLYAYSQIDNLSGIAESNGIRCPRLRGYRLMVNEQAAPDQFWEEEKYVLSPWGCLMAVLMDYGIDINRITPRMGKHMVTDFMEYMVAAGHIGTVQEGEEHDDC